MKHGPYEIASYGTEFESEVAVLLQTLWGEHVDSNLQRLRWKYVQNPHSEVPTAAVALHRGKVVGFRGFMALRFQAPGKADTIPVMAAGDTVVHADHRRKGLSMAMIRLAMQSLATQQGMYLNMTCNAKSLGGYLKAGFVPLTLRTYLSLGHRPGLWNYVRRAFRSVQLEDATIQYGRFGSILAAETPRPAEMARIVAQQQPGPAALRLYQDEAFFGWRFGSPASKFVFYYQVAHGDAVAYLVMRLSSNNQRGYIVDFAETQPGGVAEILRRAIEAQHVGILSIYHFCADRALRPTLDRLGFRVQRPLRLLDRRLRSEMPVLIRPMRRDCSPEDFVIAGLDLRRVDSWRLKEVCSDAV